ncbi:hypothetical protein B7755_002480 [Streptomyces sp. NBS 14/10]|uniref:hypothetical protein n=1 Tax=Streptomyces sp. NBS 14/10 TaxID=1945643 RepID=UPI00211B4C26|nr:hypothetical protein [Streptomyces sp. NBS 14/10]KAK1186537.1 hypothetical protein B7755_002480 [Streptomyces sp. NBS 14/10]
MDAQFVRGGAEDDHPLCSRGERERSVVGEQNTGAVGDLPAQGRALCRIGGGDGRWRAERGDEPHARLGAKDTEHGLVDELLVQPSGLRLGDEVVVDLAVGQVDAIPVVSDWAAACLEVVAVWKTWTSMGSAS